MLLTTPHYSAAFLKKNRLGVEFEIGKSEQLPEWPELQLLARSIHLPYSGINFAALDDKVRRRSIRIIRDAIRDGVGYGIHDMVLHHCGIESQEGVIVGTYERMLDALGEIADFAACYAVTVSLENQVLRSPLQLTRFGSSANDWFRILFDLDRPNVMLTLDTSHAASAVAFYPDLRERYRHLDDFLEHPELISRVHWSDSRLARQESLFADLHLMVGDGDLPKAFHRKIKRLHAIKVLEQHQTEEDLARSLAFIRSL